MFTRMKLAGAVALIAGTVGLASAASAAPATSGLAGAAGQSPITHVAQGCGPGGFRGPYGGCRYGGGRGGYGGGGYGGGGYGRRCFVRPTPFGPRRVCR